MLVADGVVVPGLHQLDLAWLTVAQVLLGCVAVCADDDEVAHVRQVPTVLCALAVVEHRGTDTGVILEREGREDTDHHAEAKDLLCTLHKLAEAREVRGGRVGRLSLLVLHVEAEAIELTAD